MGEDREDQQDPGEGVTPTPPTRSVEPDVSWPAQTDVRHELADEQRIALMAVLAIAVVIALVVVRQFFLI